MTSTDVQFTGSIPELYERYLGPMWFAPYAADLARRARSLRARRALEVAAGTGIVTRALLDALPDAGIEATDLNEAMLAVAAARTPSGRVRWSPANAMSLPFEDGRFDLVACQFAVMFFPDRVTAFREARRVLAPGGTYLFNVWDAIEANEFARIVSEVAAAAFPQNPPTFFARVPYGHGDSAGIERDLRAAGFSRIASEQVTERSRSPSARDAAFGICEGTPLRHEIVDRDARRLSEIIDAATSALRKAFGDGAIEGEMRAFVFEAAG